MDRFARLTLPASLNSLKALLDFAHAGAERAGLSPEQRNQLDLVLEELVVNVARYAYQPGNGDVELAYAVDGPGALLIEISDKGRSFNPLESSDPGLSDSLADRPTGGLGLFLVRRMAGPITYRRDHDRNTVSFRFPSPQSLEP
ncbi:MAG: ATP-binding protein [Acidobacteriia bacterium]|nr:ATP-binding protein [Terriglobia bacterium]